MTTSRAKMGQEYATPREHNEAHYPDLVRRLDDLADPAADRVLLVDAHDTLDRVMRLMGERPPTMVLRLDTRLERINDLDAPFVQSTAYRIAPAKPRAKASFRPLGPTGKRAKVKAGRRANRKRMSR